MISDEVFALSDDNELTDDILYKFIKQNDRNTQTRYKRLWKAYMNDMPIFRKQPKDYGKPCNKISSGWARYLTDTFEGFFLGNPLKISAADGEVSEKINAIADRARLDDVLTKLSTIVSIYGRGYVLAYVDEDGEIGTAALDPMQSFMIYNTSITPKPRAFCRTYDDITYVGGTKKTTRRGSISYGSTVSYFHIDGANIVWDDEYQHGFDGIPAVEFDQNLARKGLYEDQLSDINSFNNVFSAKADNVEYFSDSYMAIFGNLDEETIKFIRENRIINIKGKDAQKPEFLAKPDGDSTEEHFLDRATTEIFTKSNVCNISDEHFVTSSGQALKQRMLPMSNMAAVKLANLKNGLNSLFKLICGNPVTDLKEDDWKELTYNHTLNFPLDVEGEADTMTKMYGKVSNRTLLSHMSIVDDVDDEMEQMRKEAEEDAAYLTALPTARTDGTGGDEE